MNLKNLFQDLNPSKFVIFSCLFIFTLLFALRLDDTIEWSYWFVFFPIWIWKVLVVAGAIVGSVVWVRNPQHRTEASSANQFKGMILSLGEHLVLLIFEVLLVINLETRILSWLIVFIPLLVLSIFCVGACIWCVKNERSCEFELFCGPNILQFIFLALRLDEIITWSWVIVFIPIWIVMCLATIAVLYAIALAIILLRSPDILTEQRRGNMSSAVGYFFIVIPLLVFEILLVNRLDNITDSKYIAICVPFFISLISLLCLSFGAKGGNCWWFGIRKDFCQFLLGACPCLQEYGNISYTVQTDDREFRQQEENSPPESSSAEVKIKSKVKNKDGYELPRTVMPVLTIEMPD